MSDTIATDDDKRRETYVDLLQWHWRRFYTNQAPLTNEEIDTAWNSGRAPCSAAEYIFALRFNAKQ